MSTDVRVAGVGMIPFAKPGKSAIYSEMSEQAARAALADAGVDYTQIQQAYVGYVYGDSTSGQSALYGLGQTGIPIVNVNNNCSTGDNTYGGRVVTNPSGGLLSKGHPLGATG